MARQRCQTSMPTRPLFINQVGFMYQEDQEFIEDAIQNLVLMNHAMLELIYQLERYLKEEKQ